MPVLELIQVDGSLGVILPDEVLARLQLNTGDTPYLTETADGVRLSPCDPAAGDPTQAEA